MKMIVALWMFAVLTIAGAASADRIVPRKPAAKPAPQTYLYCGARVDEQPGYFCVETSKMNNGRVKATALLTPTEYGLFGVRKPGK